MGVNRKILPRKILNRIDFIVGSDILKNKKSHFVISDLKPFIESTRSGT